LKGGGTRTGENGQKKERKKSAKELWGERKGCRFALPSGKDLGNKKERSQRALR
jgi:hypothetical protein